MIFNNRMSSHPNVANLFISAPPFSTDPLEYDVAAHHIAFRSVFSSIVSQYSVGKIEPVLVESWRHSEDYRHWDLKVRQGVLFENGDLISPGVIIESWLRVAHLMKKRHSKSGLFEHLTGFDEWAGLGSTLPGMKVVGDTIELSFDTPMRNFLGAISFGLYSIVHPSCYNSKTGEWIDPKCAISSGPYRVSKWTTNELNLSRRTDLQQPPGPNAITEVAIRWNKMDRDDSSLIAGMSIDTLGADNWEFFGTPQANFAYIRCLSWKDTQSPCGSVQRRRALRKAFYRELAKLGPLPDLSLFPVSIPGIKSLSLYAEDPSPDQELSIRYRRSPLEATPFQNYMKAIQEVSKQTGGNSTPVIKSFSDTINEIDSPVHSHDLSAEASGLLIEAPKDDIRFMFLSKEGIRLPDTDGRITAELKKSDFDAQVINALIWDQAAIWPLAHFSLGIWARKGLFDFSQINLALPPTDLQYIRWK